VATPEPRRTVVVTGATSIVGRYLLPRLTAAAHEVIAVSRGAAPPWVPPGVRWVLTDIAGGLEPPADVSSFFLVHLAPLWLAPAVIASLAGRGLRRVVAFGSTSRFTKQASPDPGERALAQRLAEAEAAVERACAEAGVPWTIFRPTLIYGGGHDRNVSTIAAFIRRFAFFPLVAGGQGRRQPVHADDLAVACVSALEREASSGRAYDLSGGSTLTYREMVEAIFAGLGRRPRLVDVPLPLARLALGAGRRIPGFTHLTMAAADRAAEDICFDHSDAARDLGYAPRPFDPRA